MMSLGINVCFNSAQRASPKYNSSLLDTYAHVRPWKNCTVVYRLFSPGAQNPERFHRMWTRALSHIERYTCIRFRVALSHDINKVLFRFNTVEERTDVFYSGYPNGEPYYAFLKPDISEFELYRAILKVLGLLDLQNRRNVAQYIELRMDNIDLSRIGCLRYYARHINYPPQADWPYNGNTLLFHDGDYCKRDRRIPTMYLRYPLTPRPEGDLEKHHFMADMNELFRFYSSEDCCMANYG